MKTTVLTALAAALCLGAANIANAGVTVRDHRHYNYRDHRSPANDGHCPGGVSINGHCGQTVYPAPIRVGGVPCQFGPHGVRPSKHGPVCHDHRH